MNLHTTRVSWSWRLETYRISRKIVLVTIRSYPADRPPGQGYPLLISTPWLGRIICLRRTSKDGGKDGAFPHIRGMVLSPGPPKSDRQKLWERSRSAQTGAQMCCVITVTLKRGPPETDLRPMRGTDNGARSHVVVGLRV